jgi:hypothetical protein
VHCAVPRETDELVALLPPQPGIAFSLDLIETTGQYGVNEVLLSSASSF